VNIYTQIQLLKTKQNKALAILIDPDTDKDNIIEVVKKAENNKIDFIFCGGSLVTKGQSEVCVDLIKNYCKIPVVIFPGNEMHVTEKADALLFLSLVSGRNPEYLIGKQVVSAPLIKKMQLETIATGYLLIDGGTVTTAHYVSQTMPIPNNKPAIAAATAIASEMLGQKLIYLDAGSGAKNVVSKGIIAMVSKSVELPIIVGGGINNAEKAYIAFENGADIVVVGNALEKTPDLMDELASIRNGFNQLTVSNLIAE